MTTEGRPNTPSYSSSSWGGLVAASARRADGRPSKDKDATHDPEIGTTALSGATLAELRESIAALSDQVAALAENDEKARRLTLQLGMDVVQMGGALSRRVRTLEQQISPEPVPVPIPAHDPQPHQPLVEAATHELPTEAIAAPVAEPAEITTSEEPPLEESPLEESVERHQASVAEAAPADEPVAFAEPATAEAHETVEAETVEAPLVLDTPHPPIFDHSEVSSYPLRAPETTSAELFTPRPTVSKKSPIPVTTLAIVGGVVVAIIGAAVVFLTGQHHTPAHVAAPPPAVTPTPAPVAAAPAPKPAPAPAPAAPKSDSSSSHKHSDKYGSRHHHGDRDSRGGGKSDGHVLYDITPPAAPASTPAPF